MNVKNLNEEYNDLRDNGQIEFITFHPSYSYEEFIEGITVDLENNLEDNNEVKYIMREGIFKKLCKRALASIINDIDDVENWKWKDVFEEFEKNRGKLSFENAEKYVLIIDEINRGDIAKIFGELITLLEADKRLDGENELIVTLPMSGERFAIPPNVYIISTMNTADRSIALLDVALRRRFGFVEMNPKFEILQDYINSNKKDFENDVIDLLNQSIEALKKVNSKICKDKSIGRDKQIGHSFLFKVHNREDLLLVWKHEILPLLEEYCYSDYSKINHILFDKTGDSEWITEVDGIKEFEIDQLEKMIELINGQ